MEGAGAGGGEREASKKPTSIQKGKKGGGGGGGVDKAGKEVKTFQYSTSRFQTVKTANTRAAAGDASHSSATVFTSCNPNDFMPFIPPVCTHPPITSSHHSLIPLHSKAAAVNPEEPVTSSLLVTIRPALFV